MILKAIWFYTVQNLGTKIQEPKSLCNEALTEDTGCFTE